MFVASLFLLASLATSPDAGVEDGAQRSFTSSRVVQAPVIDGRLDDEAWRTVEPAGAFTQLAPHPGWTASLATEVRVLYDDEALYISARCYDPEPDRIVARITRRDRWIEADWFQVELDPRRDGRTGFFFAVNAAGVQLDGTLFDENQESTEWDGVWTAAARVGPHGWDAELRIPLSLLRYANSDRIRFGANFWRRIPRLEEVDQWQYIPPESGLRVSRFGELRGLKLKVRSVTMELAPYASGRLDLEAGHLADYLERPWDLGLDARVGLGSNFMLTVTANPDFGQLEADQVVLNLSTIETYYPEKRPFFLEDQALFRMPTFGDGGPRAELFYTRRIGQPAPQPDLDDGEELVRPAGPPRIWGAVKLAGETDSRLRIGLLQAVTSEQRARVSSPAGATADRLAVPLTSHSILRLKQGFADNSAVGAMLTAVAAPDHGAAVTGGGDLQLELADGAYNVTAKGMFSWLDSARAERQDDFTRAGIERRGHLGYAGELVLWKKGGQSWVGAVGGQARSASLALNDLGYLDRPDLLFGFGWLQFRHLGVLGPLKSVRINANAWAYRNTGLVNIGDGLNVNGQLAWTGNWETGFTLGYAPSSCDDCETRTGGEVVLCGLAPRWQAGLWGSSDSSRALAVGLDLSAQTTEHGHSVYAGLPLTVTPAAWWQLELVPAYQWSGGALRWIDTQDDQDERRFVFADRHTELWDVTLRSTITVLRDLSIQAYGQVFLASVGHSHPALSAPSDRNRLRTGHLIRTDTPTGDYDFNTAALNLGLVLRWEYQPGSLAWLVYSGSFGRDAEVAEFRFGRVLGDLVHQGARHSLMLKLTYWWG